MSREHVLEIPKNDENLIKRFTTDDGLLIIEVESKTPYIGFYD